VVKPNLAKVFAKQANLIIKDFTITPKGYHNGDQIKVEFKIYNDGDDYSDGWLINNKPYQKAVLKIGNDVVSTDKMVMVIPPGSWMG